MFVMLHVSALNFSNNVMFPCLGVDILSAEYNLAINNTNMLEKLSNMDSSKNVRVTEP